MVYPNNVKKIRNEMGMTLEKLSKKTALSASAINLIENGKRVPSVINAFKLSAALETDLGTLFPLNKFESK